MNAVLDAGKVITSIHMYWAWCSQTRCIPNLSCQKHGRIAIMKRTRKIQRNVRWEFPTQSNVAIWLARGSDQSRHQIRQDNLVSRDGATAKGIKGVLRTHVSQAINWWVRHATAVCVVLLINKNPILRDENVISFFAQRELLLRFLLFVIVPCQTRIKSTCASWTCPVACFTTLSQCDSHKPLRTGWKTCSVRSKSPPTCVKSLLITRPGHTEEDQKAYVMQGQHSHKPKAAPSWYSSVAYLNKTISKTTHTCWWLFACSRCKHVRDILF